MTLKTKYTNSNFRLWKDKVLAKVRKKRTQFRQQIKSKQIRPVLSDPNVKKYLEELLRNFFTVTTDKS